MSTDDVLPCFISAGWQGSNMQDARTAILYNPFFQAKIASFWATKQLGGGATCNSSNTPCKANQSACTGRWTDCCC